MIIVLHIKCAHYILISVFTFNAQESATYTYSGVKKGVNLPEWNPTQVRTLFVTLTILIKAHGMDHTVGRCLPQTIQLLVPKH